MDSPSGLFYRQIYSEIVFWELLLNFFTKISTSFSAFSFDARYMCTHMHRYVHFSSIELNMPQNEH